MMSFRRKKSGEKSHDLLLVMTSNIGRAVAMTYIRYGAARVSIALRSKQVVQFDLTRLYNTFQFIDL